MRLLLIPIACLALALPQVDQGKKPSLPPLPESEVPAPPGTGEVESQTPGSQPASQPKSRASAPSGKEAQETSPESPRSRHAGIGKVQRSLMGVWRVLPSASLGGKARQSIKGYLVITKTHLTFQLLQDVRGDKGGFQTGVRTYSILGKQLVTNALQGIRNGKEAGKILLDPVGHREFRKFALLAPNVLRLIQPGGQVLEFQRVEEL